MTATDPTLAGLLAGVLATPDYDLPRLVLADYLDELGDHERADFIRLQCELARTHDPHGDRFWDGQLGDGPEYYRRRKHLRRRGRELFLDSGPKWWNDLPGSWRSTGDDMKIKTAEGWEYEVRRGFVESVTCDLATFMGGPCGRCMAEGQGWRGDIGVPRPDCSVCKGDRNYRTPGIAPRLFASQPVTKVTLTDRKPLQHDATEWRWLFVGNGEARHQSFIPSELAAHLEYTGAGPTFARYPTRAAALDALSVACVAYGRANAEGHTYESMCDRCQWGAGHYIPAANCTYCRGSNKVRRHGLPPLAGTTRGMTT